VSVNSADNIDYVMQFFNSWEKGTFADLCASYRAYLAADVLYENSGVPVCHGIDASIKLIESVCLVPKMDIQTIRVDVKAIVATDDLVFTERVDWHFNSKGVATLVPSICGVMQFKSGKIVRWADYFDPTVMVSAFED
jgi:limonene-1,2-epoxide hydrolase